MGLVPADLRRTLNRARVEVVNFQAFNPSGPQHAGIPAQPAPKATAPTATSSAAHSGDAHLETHAQVTQRVLKSLLSS